MEFPYTKVTSWIKHQKRQKLLPWARVGIFNPRSPKKVIYALGLVDSGADITILDREIGENLEFEIEKGMPEDVKGLGGGSIKGFVHKVGFIVESTYGPKESIKYTDLAVFAKNPFPLSMPQQTAIYGTLGFFAHLIVTFIYPQSIQIETSVS